MQIKTKLLTVVLVLIQEVLILSNIAFSEERNYLISDEQRAIAHIENLTKLAKMEISMKNKESFHMIIRDSFDIKWIVKFVVGKYWSRFSNDEIDVLNEIYFNYLMNSYGSYLEKLLDGSFEILSVEQSGAGFLLKGVLRDTNDELFDVHIRMNGATRSFLIKDIIIAGVSVVFAQRADTEGFLSSGKSTEDLIEKLTDLSINTNASETDN